MTFKCRGARWDSSEVTHLSLLLCCMLICLTKYLNYVIKIVPNTKHFHDITLIEDVLSLYAKIKDSLLTEQFVGDVHEEFEDTEGNVLNRRIYEDLARQGLL